MPATREVLQPPPAAHVDLHDSLHTGNDLKACCMMQATNSVRNYKVHAVVANILETRMNQVRIVHALPGDKFDISTIDRDPNQEFIEPQLVSQVVQLHAQYEREPLS